MLEDSGGHLLDSGWSKRPPLQFDFALIFAVPVVDAVGVGFDQDDAGGVDALFEPAFEVWVPVFLEAGLVFDQFGLGFDGDEDRGLAEQAGFALQGESDARVAADVAGHAGVAPGKEKGIAIEFNVAVVAHGAGGDLAVFGPGREHGEVYVGDLFGEIFEGHGWLRCSAAA